jgi:hypothetical protein
MVESVMHIEARARQQQGESLPPFLFFVFSLLPKIEMDLGLSRRALLRIKCGRDLPQLT